MLLLSFYQVSFMGHNYQYVLYIFLGNCMRLSQKTLNTLPQ